MLTRLVNKLLLCLRRPLLSKLSRLEALVALRPLRVWQTRAPRRLSVPASRRTRSFSRRSVHPLLTKAPLTVSELAPAWQRRQLGRLIAKLAQLCRPRRPRALLWLSGRRLLLGRTPLLRLQLRPQAPEPHPRHQRLLPLERLATRAAVAHHRHRIRRRTMQTTARSLWPRVRVRSDGCPG